MIDLETLGVTPQAPILAIGAVRFDPDTGTLGDGFEEIISFESACAHRKPEASTIAWWLQQSDDARQGVIRGRASLEAALRRLEFYLAGFHPVVWSNGATFDIAMLEDAFRQFGYTPPWKFWNVRDVRTIVDLAYPDVPKHDFPFEGVRHSALADAEHQATYVSAMWQYLKGDKQ